MSFWLFSDRKKVGSKQRLNNAGVHLLFSGIMLAVTIILIVYIVVFIHCPNKKYMNGKEAKCKIVTAEKSCWRRRLLSSSRIEEGRHVCWLFLVRYGDIFTKVQHMDVDDFPEEHDGCKSAKSCGLEQWPCRVSRDDPKDVSLRWVYPFKPVIYCSIGIVCALLFGAVGGWRFYKEREVDDETDEENSLPEEPVPFSFRNRLPTWMRTQSSTTTMPAPVVFRL